MGVPTDAPVTKTMDWEALVREAWGDDWHEKEVVYEFSGGAKRKSTDETPGTGSIYQTS